MLQLKTVDRKTLDLIIQLMKIPELKDFRLVGGTALALQFGHRKSIDIDLFGKTLFADLDLPSIFTSFSTVINTLDTKHIKTFIINDVKVDMVSYPYNWLEIDIKEKGIRMASPKDIAAMKINAINNRGSKKDFFDLNQLLQKFTLKSIIDFYLEKYPNGSQFMALKSITYFEDAEEEDDPEILNQTTWADVKAQILSAHHNFMRSL